MLTVTDKSSSVGIRLNLSFRTQRYCDEHPPSYSSRPHFLFWYSLCTPSFLHLHPSFSPHLSTALRSLWPFCPLFPRLLSHSLSVFFSLALSFGVICPTSRGKKNFSAAGHTHTQKHSLSLSHTQFTVALRLLPMPRSIIIQHVHNFIEELNAWPDSCSASETS